MNTESWWADVKPAAPVPLQYYAALGGCEKAY